MNDNQNKNPGKGGRKPKPERSIHRYVFRLTDEENAKFLSLYDASGLDNYARFIVSVLFDKPIKTVKIDSAATDYYMRLTHFYGQFRAIGVNYNQIVKLLNRNFSEKKAAAYLFKLEKQTKELAELCRQMIELTSEFEKKHLQKDL